MEVTRVEADWTAGWAKGTNPWRRKDGARWHCVCIERLAKLHTTYITTIASIWTADDIYGHVQHKREGAIIYLYREGRIKSKVES
jgi:hypothetical protein